MTKHFMPLDLVRVFCVFYIIGIWHFNSYISPSYAFSDTTLIVLHRLTEVVLGTFTFLSGFFLAKYQFNGGADVKHFFYQRFKRFFLLLLLSVMTYLSLHWISVQESLLIMTGTLLFFDHHVSTLWFFSMLILFYLLTPVLQFKYTNKYMGSGLFLFIFVCFIILSIFYHIDNRLILYFPCYYIGLITPNNIIVKINNIRPLLWTLLSLTAFFFIHLYTQIELFCFFIVLSGIAFVLSISMVVYHKQMDQLIQFLAQSSMVAYLFHRQIFGAGKMLCEGVLGIEYIPLYYAISLLILTFVVSYYIQILYNKITSYIWK